MNETIEWKRRGDKILSGLCKSCSQESDAEKVLYGSVVSGGRGLTPICENCKDEINMDPYEQWDREEATEESDGNPDLAMVPYVECLRDQGITTYSSCGGHEDTGDWAFIQIENVGLDLRVIDENSEDFSEVTRIYPGPVWDIRFRGLNKSEECLRKNMRIIFDAIEVEYPENI